MNCPKCRTGMEMRRSFGRDHHWHCENCNNTVMVADRLSKTDRENFMHDEKRAKEIHDFEHYEDGTPLDPAHHE